MSRPTAAPADHDVRHLETAELEVGLDIVRDAPGTGGSVELVVARPREDERLVLDRGHLTRHDGLVGDGWRERYAGPPNVDAQLTLMNARYLNLVSDGELDRWPLAGDQLIVDLDLSDDNLRAGDRLRIGTALVEVTPKPHNGCKKFVTRFGVDAQRLANSPVGKHLHLRGIYVKVVEDGEAAPGDPVDKVDDPD